MCILALLSPFIPRVMVGWGEHILSFPLLLCLPLVVRTKRAKQRTWKEEEKHTQGKKCLIFGMQHKTVLSLLNYIVVYSHHDHSFLVFAFLIFVSSTHFYFLILIPFGIRTRQSFFKTMCVCVFVWKRKRKRDRERKRTSRNRIVTFWDQIAPFPNSDRNNLGHGLTATFSV